MRPCHILHSSGLLENTKYSRVYFFFLSFFLSSAVFFSFFLSFSLSFHSSLFPHHLRRLLSLIYIYVLHIEKFFCVQSEAVRGSSLQLLINYRELKQLELQRYTINEHTLHDATHRLCNH